MTTCRSYFSVRSFSPRGRKMVCSKSVFTFGMCRTDGTSIVHLSPINAQFCRPAIGKCITASPATGRCDSAAGSERDSLASLALAFSYLLLFAHAAARWNVMQSINYLCLVESLSTVRREAQILIDSKAQPRSDAPFPPRFRPLPSVNHTIGRIIPQRLVTLLHQKKNRICEMIKCKIRHRLSQSSGRESAERLASSRMVYNLSLPRTFMACLYAH